MQYVNEKELIEYILKDTPEFDDFPREEDIPIEQFIKKSEVRTGIFTEDGIHSLIYEFVLIKRYGSTWVFWEPEVLWDAIEEDFHHPVSEVAKNQIQALRTLQIINRYWLEPEVFEDVSLSLNNIIPDFDKMEYVSPAQIAFSVESAGLIDKNVFSDDVGHYVASMCSESGLVFLCDQLEVFQKYMRDIPNYSSFENLIESCHEKWDTIKDMNPNDIKLSDDDQIDVQIARALGIKSYLKMKDSQFEKQSKFISGDIK